MDVNVRKHVVHRNATFFSMPLFGQDKSKCAVPKDSIKNVGIKEMPTA